MKDRACMISAVLAFMGSLALTAYPASAEQVITLRYAHFMPTTTAQAVTSAQWCKEVEKRTSGRVKITFYPGSTLMPAPQTYDSIVRGIADIGWSIMSYTRGKFPLTEVIDLPLGYKSGYAATKLINAYYEKFKPKEFDETKVLYLHAHGPGILTTKKPVYKLEDLKGMKIRSTGLSAKIAQALGAAPVGMPITETYDALSKGVTDGVLTTVESLHQWKLAEVTNYTTENYGSAYSTGFFLRHEQGQMELLTGRHPEDHRGDRPGVDRENRQAMGFHRRGRQGMGLEAGAQIHSPVEGRRCAMDRESAAHSGGVCKNDEGKGAAGRRGVEILHGILEGQPIAGREAL